MIAHFLRVVSLQKKKKRPTFVSIGKDARLDLLPLGNRTSTTLLLVSSTASARSSIAFSGAERTGGEVSATPPPRARPWYIAHNISHTTHPWSLTDTPVQSYDALSRLWERYLSEIRSVP